MDLIFEQAQELIERSIFELLRKELVRLAYLPDITEFIGTPNAEDDFVEAQKQIVSLKGYCIEIFGVGATKSRYLKKVPRIVIQSKRIMPGAIGTPFGAVYYRSEEGLPYELIRMPGMSSELIYEIRMVFNQIRQERIMNVVVANCLPNRAYVKVYNAIEETDRFFICSSGYFDTQDFDNGVSEKVYTFKVPDVYITRSRVLVSNIPAINQINIEVGSGNITEIEVTNPNLDNLQEINLAPIDTFVHTIALTIELADENLPVNDSLHELTIDTSFSDAMSNPDDSNFTLNII